PPFRMESTPYHGRSLRPGARLAGARLLVDVVKAPRHFVFGVAPRPAVLFLQRADELFALSGNDVEVIVGELAPPLLHLTAHLLPLACQDVGVHVASSL